MKLKENTAAKIFAIILSYVLVLVLLLSAAAAVLMGYYKFYFSDEKTVTQEILTDMAYKEACYISNKLINGSDLKSYYRDKNVYYAVTEADSEKTVDTNYGGEPYIASSECTYYTYDTYTFFDGNNNRYEELVENEAGTVTVYIAENMTHNDMFSVMKKIISVGFKLKAAVILIAVGALICEIALLCWLYCAAGHSNGGVAVNYFDRIPFDILTAAAVLLGIFSISAYTDAIYSISSALTVCLIFGTADYFIALGYTLSFATRLKTGTLWKNTVIYRIFRFLSKYVKRAAGRLKYIFSGLSLIKKTLIALGTFMSAQLFILMLAASVNWFYEFGVILLVCVNAAVLAVSVYIAVILQRIKNGGERIAGGDLSLKIDTEYMFGDFKRFSESLNNINSGLQAAVDEKMKSERFKTELITNVSHDIKTPLTSIINYVDLIKKEEVTNEKAKEYIEVLDRQSGRLKKLVEDLVEASKASTGNLPISLERCDVGVLLSQALGEFEERLLSAEIYPVLNLPEESVKIMADGRHLWRVFDNLLNNVCKYAQPKTRVYLDVAKNDEGVVISFRNISRYQLNISSDELMERFVRGDSSRNTEGSGLGLSIAKSLVELQCGTMRLTVDGDLFKAQIIFSPAE